MSLKKILVSNWEIFCLVRLGMRSELTKMLQRKASVNFYMFHGGTNFGFMNGANVFDTWPYYAPDVTSYGERSLPLIARN